MKGSSYADWAGSRIDRRSKIEYCLFVGVNLVTYKSKKQSVVSCSSAESKYGTMVQVTCELIWISLKKLRAGISQHLEWCDNQATVHIGNNPMFHKRTKNIEADCHFVQVENVNKDWLCKTC